MDIDINKYKEVFISEAMSYIKVMNLSLVELEKFPDRDDLFQNIFRSVHTLKSLATTMNYQQSAMLCHIMEDLLEAIDNKQLNLAACTDTLFQCFDYFYTNIQALAHNKNELNASTIIASLHALIKNGELEKINGNPMFLNIADGSHEKLKAIEVKTEKLDVLMKLTEELLISKMKIEQIKREINHSELSSSVTTLNRLIDDLQYHVNQIRLVPIGFVFNRFTRMARDLARQQGKEINLQFEGCHIELDRLLVDEITESISHLIRNAIDHGLEPVAVRERLNKPTRGTIKLQAKRANSAIIIEVTDDGAGLNLAAIKALASSRHLLKSEEKEEIKNLIFLGISTKQVVTAISGRGLGLPIVRQKLHSIGGSVRVEFVPGKSTTFFLEVPLTVTITKILFVKVGGEIYAIPLESIRKLLLVKAIDFKQVLSSEAFVLEERSIPVLNLAMFLGKEASQLAKQPIVILHKGEDCLGLAVDALVSIQEVIIKPLGETFQDSRFFFGAALMGSHKMVLVLDPVYLIQSREWERRCTIA